MGGDGDRSRTQELPGSFDRAGEACARCLGRHPIPSHPDRSIKRMNRLRASLERQAGTEGPEEGTDGKYPFDLSWYRVHILITYLLLYVYM